MGQLGDLALGTVIAQVLAAIAAAVGSIDSALVEALTAVSAEPA